MATFNHLLDKFHAARAIVNGGKIKLQFGWFPAHQPGPDGIGDVHKQVAKGFEKGFGVTKRQMGGPAGRFADIIVAPFVNLHRPSRVFEVEPVGVLLMPLQAGLGAIHPDVDPVLLARRNLGAPQHPPRPILKAQQNAGVIIQQAARHKGGNVGTQRVDFQAGHIADQIFTMGANVAHRSGNPGAFGVGAPFGLFGPLVFELFQQPALRILDHHPLNLAQPTGAHPVARFFGHGVAGVVVGHPKNDAVFFDRLDQGLGLFAGMDHRFIQHHIEAGLDKSQGRFKMNVVGGDDVHKIDPVTLRQDPLFFQHLLPGAIVAVIGDQQILPGGFGFFRGAGKGAGYQFGQAIRDGGPAMDGPDKGVASAPDLAKFYFAI